MNIPEMQKTRQVFSDPEFVKVTSQASKLGKIMNDIQKY